MKKIEVLTWGIKHIAENHGFNASTDWQEEGEVCVWGGCNVPTLSDVQMMCEELDIEESCIEASDYGIDIFLTDEWLNSVANVEYEESGLELWKRYGVSIGC